MTMTKRKFIIILDKEQTEDLLGTLDKRQEETNWGKNELLADYKSEKDADGFYAEIEVRAGFADEDKPLAELIVWRNEEEVFSDADVDIDEDDNSFEYDDVDGDNITVELVLNKGEK